MAAETKYRIRAEANSDSVDVLIYDTIGKDWFGDGISAEELVTQLAEITAATINVRINSFGGQVFEGIAIFNALDRHKARVVTYIDGIAASIASIIALAADQVRIAKNALVMVHNPHGIAIGSARDMREMADVLDKVGGSLAGVYARKAGVDVAQAQAWMDAETWFTADEALDAGLVDVVDEETEALAAFDHSRFVSVPPRIAALLQPKNSKTAGAPGQVPTPIHRAPTEPAPEAREEPMSDKDTAAQPGAAANAIALEEARASERERIRQIYGLAHEHGIDRATADQWAASGTNLDGVRAAALDIVAQRARSEPDVRVGHDRAEDAPFKSFGEQLLSVIHAHPQMGGSVDPRLHGLNRKYKVYAAATGMSQGDPSSGGFLVAPQFSQMIWDGLNEDQDNLLARVDSYPVEGESLTFNANAETSRATGSRFGGVQAYWIAEADQITASKPKFRQVKLEPQQLAVLVYLTDKLLNNAPMALEQYVRKAAIAEIGFMTGDSIIRGTGAGKPLGLLNSASLVSVAKETNQAAATIVPNNVSKMWARLHPRFRRDAIWLHNVDVEPQLDTLNSEVKNVAGTENVGGYAPKIYDAEKGTLKGRPLVATEFCETLGTVGDLILWSPSGYAAGVRAALQSAMSMHIRFDYAETAFRFIYEVDGQPWLHSALTPYKGTNTLTTHVALATRA